MDTRIALSFSLAAIASCAVAETDTDIGTEAILPRTAVVTSEPVVDRIGPGECGNGSIAVPAAREVQLRWLATACYGPNEIAFEIGGEEVLRTVAGNGCTCMPGVSTARITDERVLGMVSGAVDVDVAVSARGPTLLAWAEIVVVDQFGEHTFTVFDHDGPSTSGDVENLCTSGSTENGAGAVHFVMTGEECDDGNLRNGDGCSALCTRE